MRQHFNIVRIFVAIIVVGAGSYPAFAGSTTNQVLFGMVTDYFVPADYDGDGKTDIAVWRPGPAGVAAFYILRSSNQTTQTFVFGQSGDDPRVVGDYDGDGKADPAVYRAGANAGNPSTWSYLSSAANWSTNSVTWGQNGDFPGPGDYDGDGRYDFVVQRNAGGGTANYFIRFANGLTETNNFGTPTDVIVPGDYDGDGKTDIATIRGSGGNILWNIKPRSGPVQTIQFGTSATDYSVQGDYNGDGKIDVAVWHPGVFYVHYSTGTNPPAGPASIDLQFPLGNSGDYPVAKFNSH